MALRGLCSVAGRLAGWLACTCGRPMSPPRPGVAGYLGCLAMG